MISDDLSLSRHDLGQIPKLALISALVISPQHKELEDLGALEALKVLEALEGEPSHSHPLGRL